MHDDMVERLRNDARGGYAYHELSDEAADEIERLRHQIQDAEIALNTWDSARNSEYWIRHQKDASNAR